MKKRRLRCEEGVAPALRDGSFAWKGTARRGFFSACLEVPLFSQIVALLEAFGVPFVFAPAEAEATAAALCSRGLVDAGQSAAKRP